MADPVVKCNHLGECITRVRKPMACRICKNNRLRNKELDFFEEAKDNPIPVKCPRITYNGPAEQTAGYKCPVCGGFTDPYGIEDSRCAHCGYKMNIG